MENGKGNEKVISISEEIFSLFPDYMRGIVLMRGVKNGESPPEITNEIRAEEKRLRQLFQDIEITAHPKIQLWREAYRTVGIKPSKFRPSIEALIRRIMQGKQLPAINTLVDIGNLFSLKNLMPIGGHAIDEIQEEMRLKMATGAEMFIPFGTENVENPEPNEIVFVDGDRVMTRRWTWRQAKHSLTLPSSTAIEYNVDALTAFSFDEVKTLCEELAQVVRQYCGGNTEIQILSRENPAMVI